MLILLQNHHFKNTLAILWWLMNSFYLKVIRNTYSVSMAPSQKLQSPQTFNNMICPPLPLFLFTQGCFQRGSRYAQNFRRKSFCKEHSFLPWQ